MATVSEAEPAELRDMRGRARWRSHFWPGSGFALLGHSGLACLGTVTIALLPATMLGLAFVFQPVFLWAFIASIVLYLCFYVAEQKVCRSITIIPGGEAGFLSRFLIPVCVAGFAGMIGVVAVFFLNVGSLAMAGTGMAPALPRGERVLYKRHAFQEDLRPGHFIVFKVSGESAWGVKDSLIAARILAQPGDTISIDGDHYLLNGKAAAPVSTLAGNRPVLDVPKAPQSLTVPAGCWFVVQDEAPDSVDSRVLSWAKEGDLVATRAIVVIGHSFGRVVE
jgi:signal peptidase I